MSSPTAHRPQGAATKVTLAHVAWDPDTHGQGRGLESGQGPSPQPQPALLISQVELRRPGPRSVQAAGVRIKCNQLPGQLSPCSSFLR